MTEQHIRSITTLTEDSSSYISPSYSSSIIMQCEKLLSLVLNKTTTLVNEQQILPIYIRQLLAKQNLTFRLPKTIPECAIELTRLANSTYELNTTIKTNQQNYIIQEHSRSLIIFIILITCVSLISIIGNLCLAKVLYSKRYRLLQTDRIVLCLAISELCLVLIDTPTEIYRLLSSSFTQEWLCCFHTFFEALFSSCIIFYHLLGAFDRFVYIHGHTSSTSSSWTKWCRHISTKSGSIILLILPIICSLPIAICNTLHAHILNTSLTNKICIIQYTHGILIGILISFYILPLLFTFFLHGKLIYFIRTRHNQYYLTKTSYLLPMKRNNITETRLKRYINEDNIKFHHEFHLQPTNSFNKRFITINTETIGGITTTTTMAAAVQLARLNQNIHNSINSSQSSRSSTAISSTLITPPIVLYKINSQANANANRTVLLLVLLLSFYVFCWAPYSIYTWYHAYKLTQSSTLNININNLTSSFDFNQTLSTYNFNSNLRRIIFINYSLYLLSMISMCFSFIFYFLLNKQARREFSRLIRCMCPWIIHIPNEEQRQQFLRQEQNRTRQLKYHKRIQNQYPYKTERIKISQPSLNNERYNHGNRVNSPQNVPLKRTKLNYGCQIQCCP
ncbi:unnamed protein product [Rotaria sp. Silwood1]|nr:unnamed protein product [Rotaria sp. Silwood1]CAF3711927.1 unnamed protein product [Rotaria sp. Silwood1]CAF4739253.1 unnamed protein product [Rotaria sp. Silwood1]CAF4970043.1 unnamed protein product [Rotaria sp. Silwood1]